MNGSRRRRGGGGHQIMRARSSVSVITVETPWLCSTAEPTQPSSVFLATEKSTRPISSSPSTLGHSSVTPVTKPLPPFSVPRRALFCARTVTGKGTTFLRRRFDLSEESGSGGDGDGFDGSGLDGSLGLSDGFSDLLVWETPSVVSLDDMIVSNPAHKFQAMGVPPLPKNRNAACGRHKEEILNQLRTLAKSEPNLMNENVDLNSFMSFQCLESEQNMQSGGFCTSFEHDAEPLAFPAYEAQEFESNDCDKSANQDFFPKTLQRSYLQDCSMVPDLNSNNDGTASHAIDGYGGQINSEASSAFPKVPSHECSLHRESALSRYKEKKKTRRYDKHIRYESRKVRAESRTRIKGRFAKMNS
ncbi:hypothetical protein M0R45_011098 [Rubus argutus]|uniref:CCT domain-containing protein n=1 Tax=Rubus argutus TaxID=59490 RepID=A0AAW1Y905_RUBAR